MSISDIEAPKRRTRGPNKPKTAAAQWPNVKADEDIHAEQLAKAERIFEDSYPFLSVELRITASASLFGTCRFGTLEVSGTAPNAQRLARDFREWARYQLWQKERAPEVEAWYREDTDRQEWLELVSRPIKRMDRPEPKKKG